MNGRAFPLKLAGWLAALACCAGPLEAVQFNPLSIPQLTRQAQLVVRGTVLGQTSARDGSGRIFTRVDLQIAEVWKGAWDRPTLSIVHSGGQVGRQTAVTTGQVRFVPHEEVVVFLVFNPRGEAVTIGLSQGKFRLQQESATAPITTFSPFHGRPATAANSTAPPLPLAELKRQVAAALDPSATESREAAR